MLRTTHVILEELKSYASPSDKLARMVKSGEYIPVVKGLYETSKATPGYLLAASIYGPSYLSFDFALSFYGLIPEAVYAFTSATFEKKKKKQYETPFGLYTYRDVPSSAFPYGINICKEGDYFYLMASPEKALCDKLYTVKPVANQAELRALLFDDLRIDEQAFNALNMDELAALSQKYKCPNVQRLVKLARRISK